MLEPAATESDAECVPVSMIDDHAMKNTESRSLLTFDLRSWMKEEDAYAIQWCHNAAAAQISWTSEGLPNLN